MRYINGYKDVATLFKALDSKPRQRIMQLLKEHKSLSMNELAEHLDVTQGAITAHIKALHSVGVVNIQEEKSTGGLRKVVKLSPERIQIDLVSPKSIKDYYKIDIPVGSYNSYKIKPPCGLASREALIGQNDNVDSFKMKERINAEILWFASGFVEYEVDIPEDISGDIEELELTMEISSEAPGYCEEWPSDVTFYFNDLNVGTWISPGDYGEQKGKLNPSWWDPVWNQYGLLKRIQINNMGTFIDGENLSPYNAEQVLRTSKSKIKIKIAVLESSENIGGVTLFGKGFGNYDTTLSLKLYRKKNI